jgi:hypothetical protein
MCIFPRQGKSTSRQRDAGEKDELPSGKCCSVIRLVWNVHTTRLVSPWRCRDDLRRNLDLRRHREALLWTHHAPRGPPLPRVRLGNSSQKREAMTNEPGSEVMAEWIRLRVQDGLLPRTTAAERRAARDAVNDEDASLGKRRTCRRCRRVSRQGLLCPEHGKTNVCFTCCMRKFNRHKKEVA